MSTTSTLPTVTGTSAASDAHIHTSAPSHAEPVEPGSSFEQMDRELRALEDRRYHVPGGAGASVGRADGAPQTACRHRAGGGAAGYDG